MSMAPSFEIHLTLPAPGMGWEYVARKQGEVIAASDGDANFENVGPAFAACVAEINQHFAAKNRAADMRGERGRNEQA